MCVKDIIRIVLFLDLEKLAVAGTEERLLPVWLNVIGFGHVGTGSWRDSTELLHPVESELIAGGLDDGLSSSGVPEVGQNAVHDSVSPGWVDSVDWVPGLGVGGNVEGNNVGTIFNNGLDGVESHVQLGLALPVCLGEKTTSLTDGVGSPWLGWERGIPGSVEVIVLGVNWLDVNSNGFPLGEHRCNKGLELNLGHLGCEPRAHIAHELSWSGTGDSEIFVVTGISVLDEVVEEDAKGSPELLSADGCASGKDIGHSGDLDLGEGLDNDGGNDTKG